MMYEVGHPTELAHSVISVHVADIFRKRVFQVHVQRRLHFIQLSTYLSHSRGIFNAEISDINKNQGYSSNLTVNQKIKTEQIKIEGLRFSAKDFSDRISARKNQLDVNWLRYIQTD